MEKRKEEKKHYVGFPKKGKQVVVLFSELQRKAGQVATTYSSSMPFLHTCFASVQTYQDTASAGSNITHVLTALTLIRINSCCV